MMRKLMLIAALATCAAAHAETFEMDVKWTRAWSPIAEVHDGFCHLFYTDNREDEMNIADSEVRQCSLKADQARASTDASTKRIRFVMVESNMAVGEEYSRVYNVKDVFEGRAAGFYRIEGDTCVVVASKRSFALGHEIKHCFDGDFHKADVIRRRLPAFNNYGKPFIPRL